MLEMVSSGCVRIFVHLNGAPRKYYSNTVRLAHIRGKRGESPWGYCHNTHSYRIHQLVDRLTANNQIRTSLTLPPILAKRTILAISPVLCVTPPVSSSCVLPDRRDRGDPSAHQDFNHEQEAGRRICRRQIHLARRTWKDPYLFKTAKRAGMEGSTRSSSSSTAGSTIRLFAEIQHVCRGPSPPTNPHGSSLSRSMTNHI